MNHNMALSNLEVLDDCNTDVPDFLGYGFSRFHHVALVIDDRQARWSTV
ncbi:hypothetical protein ACK1VC_25820 [Pseudomonas sp. XP2]